MATATQQVNVRIQLGSAGNLIVQELIRSRKSDKRVHLHEIGAALDSLLNYGGTIDTEVEGTDYVRSVGAVNYTAGTTATAYTVTIAGQASGSATGVAGNGLSTAIAMKAVIDADPILSRWVETSTVDTGSSTGRLVLTLRGLIGNAGDLGNKQTLAATGVGATASAATFGSGTGGVAGTNSPSTNLVGQL